MIVLYMMNRLFVLARLGLSIQIFLLRFCSVCISFSSCSSSIRDWVSLTPRYQYELTSGIFNQFSMLSHFPLLASILSIPDFQGFIVILFIFDHLFISSQESCICSLFSHMHTISSAYPNAVTLFASNSFKRSLIKRLNMRGDSTEPYTSPLFGW